MRRIPVRRATLGVVAGAFLGLVPTVLVAMGQVSPPESPPVSPPTSTTTTVPGPDTAVSAGNTWYGDGANSHSGPPGTSISAFATGAFAGLPYRLVLGTGDRTRACVSTVAVVNPVIRYATRSGFIGTTVGTVGPEVPPGTYKLCFEDTSTGNFTGTTGATITVTAGSP